MSCAWVPHHVLRVSCQGGVDCTTWGKHATVSKHGCAKATAVLDICDFVNQWRLHDSVVYHTLSEHSSTHIAP